jgi:transposase
MTFYIGCDFHPYQQTVAFCDPADGAIHCQTLRHKERAAVRQFYAQFPAPVVVGLEACGKARWFETLLAEVGCELRFGDPSAVRCRARSRHKSDRRDAELLLDLLVKGEFPTLWRRPAQSQAVLEQLRLRHALVRQRTACWNHLQALARLAGLARGKLSSRVGRERLLSAPLTTTEQEEATLWFGLADRLGEQILRLDQWLVARAGDDESVRLIKTHPGVGTLTALCLVHTLGEASRFSSAAKVVAYAGLDPVEDSSGERRAYGSISKAGSRLLRFLLGQAALQSLKQDQRLRQFYENVRSRRGQAKAKVAAARKLLIRCWIMLRDEISYAEFVHRGASKLACPARPVGAPR